MTQRRKELTEETRKILNRLNGDMAWTVYALLLLAFMMAVAGAAGLSLYQQHAPDLSCRWQW